MPGKILLADDDPDVVEDLSLLFEDEGYSIITARNGEEALEKIRSEVPDLVILDLLMPRVDGFTVLKTLSEESWRDRAAMPVVVLTSIREEISQRRYELETGERMRPAAYVEKPYDHEQLLELIVSLMPA